MPAYPGAGNDAESLSSGWQPFRAWTSLRMGFTPDIDITAFKAHFIGYNQ